MPLLPAHASTRVKQSSLITPNTKTPLVCRLFRRPRYITWFSSSRNNERRRRRRRLTGGRRSRGAARRRCGDVCATMLDHRARTTVPNRSHHTHTFARRGAPKCIHTRHNTYARARARSRATYIHYYSTPVSLPFLKKKKRRLITAFRCDQSDGFVVALCHVAFIVSHFIACKIIVYTISRYRTAERRRAGPSRARRTKGGGTDREETTESTSGDLSANHDSINHAINQIFDKQFESSLSAVSIFAERGSNNFASKRART